MFPNLDFSVVKALQLCPIIGPFVLTGGCLLSCTVLGSCTGNKNNVFIKKFIGRDKGLFGSLLFEMHIFVALLGLLCFNVRLL